MLAKVKVLFSVWMSIIINLPIGSEYDFRIWKVKLLLKSMPTPTLALDKLLKIAEYPHSEDHNVSLSFVQ